MRFSDNGYYIERYVKCTNCGMLIYSEGITRGEPGAERLFCSEWCAEWAALRASGAECPVLPLPKGGTSSRRAAGERRRA